MLMHIRVVANNMEAGSAWLVALWLASTPTASTRPFDCTDWRGRSCTAARMTFERGETTNALATESAAGKALQSPALTLFTLRADYAHSASQRHAQPLECVKVSFAHGFQAGAASGAPLRCGHAPAALTPP